MPAARCGSLGHPHKGRGGVPRENILQLLPVAVAPSQEQLVAYWRNVAERALPYLSRRSLKLVRHTPGTIFYHKVRCSRVRVWVDSLAGLLGLVEMDVVEVHPWAATVDDIEHPDQLVLDLDPGAGVVWGVVVESALKLRDLLHDEGLDSWPKLTAARAST
jgi:bifunctional non-homologous end joining protein LigD